MNFQKDNQSADNKAREKNIFWLALNLATELGYLIAIPLVIFALIGRLLDKKFHTSPWLLLTGILISLAISSFLIYKKTAEIISDTQPTIRPDEKDSTNKTNKA